MKKYIFIYWLLLLTTTLGIAKAQNNGQLYIIYDPQAPDITRDLNRYMFARYSRPAQMVTFSYGRFQTTADPYDVKYSFQLPLFSEGPLSLYRKVNKPIITVPLNQVSSLYPDAKTITQLDDYLTPWLLADREAMQTQSGYEPYDYKTSAHLLSFRIYVIEYDYTNNKAIVSQVKLRSWLDND